MPKKQTRNYKRNRIPTIEELREEASKVVAMGTREV